MAEPADRETLFHFGVFELDLRAGELRKRGIRIKIQEQPLQILGLLIECPGEVVTREQIQKKLWNGDTFVDFDNAINSAVRKMRDALGDTSENPRFVETVARHGYRFIAPIKQHLTTALPVQENHLALPVPLSPGPESAHTPEKRAVAPAATRRGMSLWVVAGAVLLIAAGAAVWQAGRTREQELWSGVMLAGPTKAFEPRLSPNGQLLAFVAIVDRLPQLAVMEPDGSGWTPLTSDRDHGYITTVAWAPDSSKIYFDRMWGHPLGIYSVSQLGGDPRLLLDEAFGPEPLPDGSLIVVKLTDQGDNQLFHFWPESGKLEALPAFLQKSDITPMLRAFPGGKELVYFGTTGKERSHSARMLVFDLASRRTRELAPGLRVDPVSDGWSPLGVAQDGESVYLATKEGDTQPLVQVPRKPGSPPRTLLSFPTTAAPVAMDAARDGSLYLDLLQTATVILRVPATGGAGEEFAMPTLDNFPMIAPGGEVLVTLKGWGKQYLAAVRPGGEPRALVETTEETTLPATIFGGNVAFVIGSG
ncbi:MAG: winged helix-turn-helix domain-containing protein, partial [Bryobacteraceae bacterium]